MRPRKANRLSSSAFHEAVPFRALRPIENCLHKLADEKKKKIESTKTETANRKAKHHL